MTAHDRACVLRQRLSEIREAQKHEKLADTLEDKRHALEEHRLGLNSAIESASVLVKQECLTPNALPMPKALADTLEQVVKAFGDDPASIAKGRNFTGLCKKLAATRVEVTNASAVAWQRLVSTAPRTNETLLSKIAQIKGMRSDVNQLRTASANLEAASAMPPTSQDAWNAYEALRKLVEDQVKALNTDRFPKSALDFCVAAQSDGALLSMLTDDVRTWLEENDMLDDLRYRFR